MHYLSNKKVQVFLNLNSSQYIDFLDKIKGKLGNVSMLNILTFQRGLHFGTYRFGIEDKQFGTKGVLFIFF